MKEPIGKRLKRWRFPLFCGVTLAVGLIVHSDRFQSLYFFRAVENSTLDLRFALRGAEDPAKDAVPIVIVKIDDRSLYPKLSEQDLAENPDLRYFTEGWPWNRGVHARLAARLLEAGARSVIFDLTFPAANEGDFALLDLFEAHPGRIVIGYDYAAEDSGQGEIFIGKRLPYDDLLPVDYSNLLGFVNVKLDDDGAVRRAKLSTNTFFEQIPFTESAEMRVRLHKAGEATEMEYSLAARAALTVAPDLAASIPHPMEYPLINYGAPEYFRSFSYIDVLMDDRSARQTPHYDGAIVFVGAYSDFFKDIVMSPYGEIYGVDSHAHATRSLLNDSFYREIGGEGRWLILALVALLLLAGTLYFRTAPSKGLFIFGLLLAYLLVLQISFSKGGYVLPSLPVVLIIVLPGILFLLYDFTVAQYERNRLHGYLGRYVSEEIADIIVSDSHALDSLMRGANRPIVALFSDIRSFTSLSERVGPEQLVAQLNEYFEEMVSIIHLHRGSLNKYIGDAILAVWGGIHSEGPEQDCENAVHAAMRMVEGLKRLNAGWSQRPDREELSIGIGLSFGEGFVGNLGHSQRMEFAVMGDVVNLASRLEGATKLYDGSILVNDALARQCGNAIRFQEVDRLQVKGKAENVPVHSPINLQSDRAPDWLARWEAARARFLERDFAAAEAAFTAIAAHTPEQAKNALLFVERCRAYQVTPPPENWDGIFQMTTK